MPLVMLDNEILTNIYEHLQSVKSINIILYAILTLLQAVEKPAETLTKLTNLILHSTFINKQINGS